MIDFCSSVTLTQEDRDLILKSLPSEWDTEVYHFVPDNDKEVHIRINVKTIEDTKKWLCTFQKITNTYFSVFTVYSPKGRRVRYKKRYNCHLKTRHKDTYDSSKRIIRNTNCPALIIIAIKKVQKKYQGKNNPVDPKKPCEIRIKLQHNHPLDTPEILKLNKVSSEAKDLLLNLFARGYNASTALKEMKSILKENYINYKEIITDRNKCPDYNYTYNLYMKFLQSSGSADEVVLTKLFEKYNSEVNDICAEMAICEDGIVVCLCPPITKRAHHLKNSGKIVFVDSFSCNNELCNKVYLFFTYSAIGCIPLAVVVTNSTSEMAIRIGFSLLKEMLDNIAFHGNLTGPDLFIMDEDPINNSIITSVWPRSKIYFNIFHILKKIWQWVSDAKNNITPEDRALLFKDFYNTLYAQDEISFNTNFQAAHIDLKYEHFADLLNNYFEKREKWAVYCKPDILKEDNGDIKSSEISIRFLRSNLFRNFTNFDFVPIINFILDEYFSYFENNCLNIISNDIPDVFYTHLGEYNENLLENLQNLEKNMNLLPSKSINGKFYVINTDLLTCTCSKTNAYEFCKHVQYVTIATYIKTFEINCQNEETKKLCSFLVGQNNIETQNNHNYLTYIEDGKNYEEDCLKIAEKEETKGACVEVWRNITTNLESFIETSSEELAPVIENIASKFETINTVQDLRYTFNIFDPVPKKNDTKTIGKGNDEDEENIENIAKYLTDLTDT